MNETFSNFITGATFTLLVLTTFVLFGRLTGAVSIGRSASPSVMVVDTTGKVCKLDVTTGATK